MTISFRSDYFATALDPAEVYERAEAALIGVEFDTIVGTGMSGVLPLQCLADEFGCDYLAVRKPGDSGHSDSLAEGTLGGSWLFLDDFISSGSTFVRVKKVIDQLCWNGYETACAGAFCYDELPHNRWRTLPALRVAFPAINSAYLHAKGKTHHVV